MIVRLGLGVRIMSLFLVSLLLYSAVVQGKTGWMWTGSMAMAIFFVIYAWSYKTCVTESGISVRYFPLVGLSVRWSDVIQLVESLNPVCITVKTRFRIWGLTPKTRSDFLQLVPRHLLASEDDVPSDIALREFIKYQRMTKILGLAFVIGVVALIPFLDNNPLNRYWRPFGQIVVLAVGGLWLGLLFAGGMAYIHRRAHRELG